MTKQQRNAGIALPIFIACAIVAPAVSASYVEWPKRARFDVSQAKVQITSSTATEMTILDGVTGVEYSPAPADPWQANGFAVTFG